VPLWNETRRRIWDYSGKARWNRANSIDRL